MAEILEVKNLCFSYNKKPFLKDISFKADEGEFISIIGENGSGKTTLFKVLNTIYKKQKGSILYKNKEIEKIGLSQRAKEIAVIYQGLDCRFPFTAFEVAAMGLYPHKGHLSALKKEDIDFIKNIMCLTDTLEFAEKRIDCLSVGQAQRVLLARALVQKPKLLFLDEAMSGFDISVKIKMTKLLKDLCIKKGMTVISIQHDLNIAFENSDKIIALKGGELYKSGSPEKVMSKEFFQKVFNVNAEICENGKYFRITN